MKWIVEFKIETRRFRAKVTAEKRDEAILKALAGIKILKCEPLIDPEVQDLAEKLGIKF